MGWFDEQIKQRKQSDQDVFADAFINIAGAVMGSRLSSALNDERQQMKNAFDEILRFYHINTKEIPDNITDRNEQLEYLSPPWNHAPHGNALKRLVQRCNRSNAGNP